MKADPGNNNPENETAISPRTIWCSALAWTLFCAAAIIVRGVRWDETYEHAQILAGFIPYPANHPLRLYLNHAFSLQPYLSAWIMQAGAGPLLLCGLRNFLFLAANVLPIFWITATLARQTWPAHCAVLLLLQGLGLEFDGSYPLAVWPELYSNGPIGGGWAWIVLAACLADKYRTAAFLCGCMPLIHLGQWPPILLLITLIAGYDGMRGAYRPWMRAVPYALIGLSACAAFFLWQRAAQPPLSIASEDSWTVWKGYTALFDPHRRFPPGNGHLGILSLLLLAGFAAKHYPQPLRRPYMQLAAFAAIVAGLVWGIMLIHAAITPNIPFALISWMPYRLINLLPFLTLAAIAAILAQSVKSHAPQIAAILPATVLFVTLQPLLSPLIGPALYARYLSTGEAPAFALFGAALYCVIPNRPAARLIPVLLAIMLAGYHQFGAAMLLAGTALAWTLQSFPCAIPSAPILRRAAVALILLSAAALLKHQAQFRQSLPLSPFECLLAEYLQKNAPKEALLLGPPDGILLQARSNHPVLAEAATPSLISYIPAVGPAIAQCWQDLYGVDLRGITPATDPWQTLWRNRTAAEWRALAQQYQFTYIAAPANVPLQLTPVLSADTGTLYQTPPITP